MLLPILGLVLMSDKGTKSCCGGDMTPFTADPAFMAMHRPGTFGNYIARSGAATTFKEANGKDTNGFYVPPAAGARVAIVMVHMTNAGKPLTVIGYDAGHGFANPNNPSYDKKSADEAYEHTIAFFKRNLS